MISGGEITAFDPLYEHPKAQHGNPVRYGDAWVVLTIYDFRVYGVQQFRRWRTQSASTVES